MTRTVVLGFLLAMFIASETYGYDDEYSGICYYDGKKYLSGSKVTNRNGHVFLCLCRMKTRTIGKWVECTWRENPRNMFRKKSG